jgi:HlyD family secretion protein
MAVDGAAWRKTATDILTAMVEEIRSVDARALARASQSRALAAWSRTRHALEAPLTRVDDVSMDLRAPIMAGAALVVFGFGGFTAWAAFVPLRSAVMAPGVVAVESKRRVVQHLEGGIVAEMAVRDGQLVRAGDLLMRLDDTQSASRRSQLDARLIAAASEMARLEAERADGAQLAVDGSLAKRQLEPAVARVLAIQADLLTSRRSDRAQRRAMIGKQIEQISEEVRGLKAQVASREKKRLLSDERLAGLVQLAAKGYASRVQVAGLESELAAIDGELGELAARIAAAHQKSEQLREQLLAFEASAKSEIADRLQATQRELVEAQEALLAADYVRRRTEIRAGVAGTIVGLNVHTVGAVVSPGEALMEIVPMEDTLVVEAQIGTEDIDVVHPGLPVQVRLAAYSFRSTPPIAGTLMHVSADRVVDPRTGTASYPARAVLDPAALAAARNVHLYPGMTAEVAIIKGDRTLVDYMLDPLLKATNRAFLEN